MDLRNPAPWNWFKKKDVLSAQASPVTKSPCVPLNAPGLLKPLLDSGSSDREYSVALEIPGLNRKDVKLEIVDNRLFISGKRQQEAVQREDGYYFAARSQTVFQRVLPMPDDVDQDNIQARLRKGALKIRMPRLTKPRSDVRRIEVRKAA